MARVVRPRELEMTGDALRSRLATLFFPFFLGSDSVASGRTLDY